MYNTVIVVTKLYNTTFFDTWSGDMAYALGFLFADGNISINKKGSGYVAFYSADWALLYALQKSFNSNHKIAKRSIRSGEVYRLQVGSKVWIHALSGYGMTPLKSKRMQCPTVPEMHIGDFIRGYFDGDGNVWSGVIHKKQKTSHITLQVAFTSCSHEFLSALHKMLCLQGMQGGSMYRHAVRNFSRLSFSMQDSLNLYKIMYNGRHKLFLKRKKVVFEQFMKCGRRSTG